MTNIHATLRKFWRPRKWRGSLMSAGTGKKRLTARCRWHFGGGPDYCASKSLLELNHSQTFVSKRGHHINGIENFWNQSKRHLRRFNGIPKSSFYWFLKECEWRFNGGNHNTLLKQLKSWYQSEINKL